MEKLPNWLRWALILPFSILALLIIYPIVKIGNNICNSFFIGPDKSPWIQLMTSFLSNGASSAGFVYAGAKIAPRHNFVVSVILAIILGFILGISFISQVMLGNKSSTPWLELIIAIIAGFVCAIATVKHFHDEEMV